MVEDEDYRRLEDTYIKDVTELNAEIARLRSTELNAEIDMLRKKIDDLIQELNKAKTESNNLRNKIRHV